jgi:transcriptional regulator with XRE-family HTH domain
MPTAGFPSWFKNVRERKKLSQTKTAAQLDLSSPTISRWESGMLPRAEHLPRICKWAPIAPEKLLRLMH